jgi:VanZ family protein
MKLFNNKKFQLYFAWFLFLVTLFMIMDFSLDTGEISFQKSWYFVRLFQFLQRWIPTPTLHAFIRKFGHLFEYFLLGMASFHLIAFYTPKRRNLLILPLLAGCFISSSDECIQRFITTNRSGAAQDVLLDMIGVGIGILVLYIGQQNRIKKNP